ncbi:DUF4362 domain-containing protein [Paenibacillus sp. GCM10027626]|uniref:DUF4362 domain-containing protein n=1 Tax=Paenibacillus sp. GCM10027626 TaxID=3273411 RepID=UPI003636E2F7
MRISRVIILGAVLLLGLPGCGTKQEVSLPTAPSPAHTSGAQASENNDDQVIVSRTLGFSRVNEKPYGTFFKKEEIAVFAKAVKSADKMQGMLDVPQSDYDVVLVQGGKRKEFHLWVDASTKYGMITYVSETGQGYRLTEKSTRALYDLIWGLKYDSKQAETNGDIVNIHGKLINQDVWEQFAANVKSGAKSEVQVVQYTIEGDPIFNNLSFDGETIRNIYENTHDAYGTPMKRYAFCKAIEEKKSDQGTVYELASCGEGEAKEGWFSLLVP